ncbi:MAG: NAD+ synthase, partial [Candidatus Omnitrophica bacterium]|nr:NAD+ synthase [Candidatus Omnitrophota bacterium]
SPYHAGKVKEREDIIKKQAKDNRVAIAYVNLVGGQDELVFDGQSMVVDTKGKLIARAGAFKEELLIADLMLPFGKKPSARGIVNVCLKISENEKPVSATRKAPLLNPVAEVYQALVLGLHDYVTKNNFAKAVIGLSGGIDSSLVASLAVDALGKENVVGVFMPSEYSSQESQEDAFALAQNLGIQFFTVPINGIFKAYLWELRDCFSGKQPDITEENLQARVRGNILMALSNKFRWLVLTTGNKSEMSTGYSTLYGDMAGGFAVIKDVPKILVYRLTEYRNSFSKVIPERVITKAPTAELRPNQKDSDTLPPYETLDAILKAYVEQDKDLNKIISLGFSEHDVRRVLEMVDRSEYKRRQSPPGIKITHKSFGKDRRMPITNRYKG